MASRSKLKRAIQKEAFTTWANSVLEKNLSSYEIDDLFKSLRNGRLLGELLESLSGDRLRRLRSGKSRQQAVDNVEICLNFLKEKRVSTRGIDSKDIVDGCPDTTLELMWAIITGLYINKKELLKRRQSKTVEEALLLWAQDKTQGYRNVRVKGFTSSSWKDGLAFLALINAHRPHLIRFKDFHNDERRRNLRTAFDEAEDELGIPSLLDVEDLMNSDVDERAVAAYVACFYKQFAGSKHDNQSKGSEPSRSNGSGTERKRGSRKDKFQNGTRSSSSSGSDRTERTKVNRSTQSRNRSDSSERSLSWNRCHGYRTRGNLGRKRSTVHSQGKNHSSSSSGQENEYPGDTNEKRIGKHVIPNSSSNDLGQGRDLKSVLSKLFEEMLRPQTVPLTVRCNPSPVQFEWQFQDDCGAWITFGAPNSAGSGSNATTTTSDDIENHYVANPNGPPMLLQSKQHSYELNFQSMTRTNQKTFYQRPIRRIYKSLTGVTPLNGSVNVNAGVLPQTVPQAGHSDLIPENFEWQVLDETGAWISYGKPNSAGKVSHATTICSDDIERHHASNPANPAPLTIQNNIKCSYVLDFKNMTQTNQQTSAQRRIRRVREATPSNTSTPKGSTYVWSFKDEHGNWIKYGEASSSNGATSATTTTSDDIETKYARNPTASLEIASGRHKYIIDFNTMTQTNINTKAVRAIRRQELAMYLTYTGHQQPFSHQQSGHVLSQAHVPNALVAGSHLISRLLFSTKPPGATGPTRRST